MLDIGPGITAVFASLVTGGCALAGVMLMTRSNTRQAQSQRTWNARKQCYTSILARLKEASEAADIVDRGYNSGEGGVGPHDTSVLRRESNRWTPLGRHGRVVSRNSALIISSCPTSS